jgi:hypothetical protein
MIIIDRRRDLLSKSRQMSLEYHHHSRSLENSIEAHYRPFYAVPPSFLLYSHFPFWVCFDSSSLFSCVESDKLSWSSVLFSIQVGIETDKFPHFSSDLQLIERLISEESVFCLPGQCFDFPNFMRVVLTVPKELTIEACNRMSAFFRRHYVNPERSKIRSGLQMNSCDSGVEESERLMINLPPVAGTWWRFRQQKFIYHTILNSLYSVCRTLEIVQQYWNWSSRLEALLSCNPWPQIRISDTEDPLHPNLLFVQQ